MKIKAVFAAALSAVILTGCAAVFDELDDGTYEEGTLTDETTSAVTDEKTSLSYGKGLEEITITAKEDPDPDRKIQRRRTPVRQMRGVDINGNTLSDDFYFYRSLLSGTYKQAYDQIYAALYNGRQTINMSVSVYSSDIANIVYSVYYDHPELFWVDSSLTYYMNGSGIVTSLTVNFNGTASDLKRSQQLFEGTIAPLIKLASSLPEDIQKVKLVHDYLTNTIQYVSGSAYNQSAYSAIVNGKTVCAGYAHAFQYCMQKLGIPAAYIVGYAGENHAWNLLQLDGEYYSMDVTWDDPIGNPATTYYYDYFNVTDAYLSKDHTRDALSAKLPAAYGTQYSFGTYFGGTEYGSDFTGLDYSATMPSDYNIVPVQTQPVQTTTTAPVQTEPSYTEPAQTTPAYTTPAYTTPAYTTPAYTTPAYTEPDDDYSYIDDWSDEDWDNYWNDMDDWLDSNGYDDIDYDNYDDWEDYYFGDSIDDDYYYDDYYYDDYHYDDYYDDDDDYYDDFYDNYYYNDYYDYDEYGW